MTANGWLQIAVFVLAVLLATKPLGLYLVAVYDGRVRWLAPVERMLFRWAGVDPAEDQHWTRYAGAMLLFSAASMLLTYLVLRLQHLLPLNPQGLPGIVDRQAFETAASFTTNTNWQSYSGETTMSYLSQMTQLAFHNFVSAAVGMALAVALVRGIVRRSAGGLGNFWVDLVRGTLYVLLPLSVVLALILVQQGAIQNFRPYLDVTTLEGAKQTIAMGPVASQEAIKQLGTNGGGFFNANAAHPFENPTPWTNFWSMFTIFLIPSALTWLLGRMTGNQRHGWAVWSAIFILFFAGVTTTYWSEARGNPIHAERGVDVATTITNPGGNMEGKEVRFGIANSALYATVTTDASCGAVNAMHDSFTPLGGMVPLVNIQLGEVVFGGVGAGLYGILVMVILTVFIAGLMVGRTPEYLGKRIQAREVQVAMLYVLVFPATILMLTAFSARPAVAARSGPQDDECGVGRAAGGWVPLGTDLYCPLSLLGGDAAGRRGPGRVHRRPAGVSEHGRRFVGPPPIRGTFRATHHPKRYSPHGGRCTRGADLHRWRRRAPRSDVQH
jgi:K+-transporting ATPase ATPase A chain